ncbi:hypothetical protein HPP92_004796 [Vanilla planifolia]|uniref:Uncharacterized protein n=1 Tax=Vanilla planifolia TaxID=51239 RepID=A0A835RJ26_VANPL|nr:hypothetical protein HPP92_004796 [Vanilla planifolia]
MARRKNRILRRAYDLLSDIPMARFRKPINEKLLLFKKKRGMKLYHHYNYAFIGENEFSPSRTPFLRHLLPLRSFFSFLLCGGSDRTGDSDEKLLGDEMLFGGEGIEILAIAARESEEKMTVDAELTDEGDASVDGKAERFIEKFYEELRSQK